MKILFVCWANVGRSQMAAALHNKHAGSKIADSAGTEVDVPGETLLERRNRVGRTYTIAAMDREGIDVRDSRRTQVTKEMLDNYDLVISMAQKEYTPDWLANHPAYRYWDIKDPGGKDYEATVKAMDAVKLKLNELE